MPPVDKKLIPTLLSRLAAAETDCLTLYEDVKKRTGTNQIAISVKGVRLRENGYDVETHMITLPRASESVLKHAHAGYEHYEITVQIAMEHLKPETLMTRAEFVIELSDLWENMLNTLPVLKRETAGAVFISSRELLLQTYQARELGDIDYLMKLEVEELNK